MAGRSDDDLEKDPLETTAVNERADQTLPFVEPNQTLRLRADDIANYQSKRRLRGSLLVIAGIPADIGKHEVVDKPVVIGRDPEGLHLRDGNISRRHAIVQRASDEGYTVADLGSTNGTLLNGARLQGSRKLADGDKIVIGQTVIKFDMVDETELTYHEQVERLVSTDDLTGLVVKRSFDAHLAEAIRVARVSKKPLCAMMMDMDGLKAINDRHGHHVGANTISQVGVLIKGVLKNRGDACRFGGDEFSAFVPACDKTMGMMIAEQIRQTVEAQTYVIGPVQVRATISIGVALLSPEGDVQSVIEAADQALYRAKGKGRNVTSD